ncbi:MAG: EAL domain-containing protein [Methylobacteriaceae bacterium]|nr:EAL domain-containing protein [Methylobacteriaceae bacterium]
MLETDLRAAIEGGQLFLHYQPQMTADGARVASVEALMRWMHPQLGLLMPHAFIGMAERCGLIIQLGAYALTQAARDSLRWPGLTVSVNVSPSQLHAGFADEAFEIIRRAGGDPRRIELEITENALMSDLDRGRDIVARARARGFRIALDDFGTGFSSLAYLRDLTIDKLKIDRSFVRETHLAQGAAIVHAIVALGRALGLKITAEGVETRDQQIFLKAAGCHFLQGFLFSRPVAAETIDAMLAAEAPARARA